MDIMRRISRRIFSNVFALLLCGAALAAQALPGTAAAPQPPAPPPAPSARALPQAPTIVTSSDLVNMVFSVQDKHGAFVPNLTKDDFRVLDDGHPQTIRFFSAENQLPVTLGLLLDTSPSQAGVLGEEQQISDAFFRRVMTPKDLAFVIGFDVNTSLLRDLTASTDRLTAAINGARIGGADASGSILNPGPFPSSSQTGATHLWDAIYLACHDELAQQVGRKAIIVVTDGGEQGSTYTDQDALRAALDSNTVVFAVFAYDRGFSGYGGSGRGPGPGQLQHIAEETGGRSYDVGTNVQKAFDQIQQELRSQYSLGYRPDPPAARSGFHAVKIELTGPAGNGAKVRARSGYYPAVNNQP